MINKLILLSGFFTMTAVATTAQTIEKKLDKLQQDPKTEENRAKADVYLHRHKIMEDSVAGPQAQRAASQKKKAKKFCTKQNKTK